ncbi:hypothetical protein GH714_027800 [Hevea brasiliensis]|uniref:Uncharacterized protein n=1 Tax=Hevea brasiliensis TaxID=3981 RepID=A0A6A6LGR8_HEVBR|nr:hypothetical protein GH714_027800 [Hevea brasiliensis]
MAAVRGELQVRERERERERDRGTTYLVAVVRNALFFIFLQSLGRIVLVARWLLAIRMCRALMPGEEESMSDEAIWETLPHFWVAISMVFFVAATVFALLKLCGDVGALGWWDLFINFGIAECFAFLVCTKWSNPVIHRNSQTREVSSSSATIRYLDWNSGLVVSPEENQLQDRMCGLQDIGGHIMKIPLIGFQFLLCMRLEGTPAGARNIPLPILFSPLFLLQGVGVLFAASKLVEKLVLLLKMNPARESISDILQELMTVWGSCTMVLGYWAGGQLMREVERSRPDSTRRELLVFADLFTFHSSTCSYNTFCGYPPEIVKKMPKKDLAEE